ncbi:Pr6Pr family membrane protein [Flavisphingomonas formosensis]|uniref:Pr6Pr family membrane protein n=1 Tax=Flavisphingomonas formosensis TaxID=861534 RepID=UPI0012FA4AA4|nr:Pr6Pr family membrane protein [Sphingomonas formosensis]
MTRGYRLASGLLGWFAVVAQLVLMLSGKPADELAATVIRFFSFFTILSNILVATCQTASALAPDGPIGRFCLRADVRGAAAVYIAVVMGIYIALLNGLIPLSPAGWVIDRILHYIVPPLFLLDWVALTPHGSLRWTDAPRWVVPPLAYAAWTFGHGAVTGFYPYPFVDVTKLGAGQVTINSCAVALLFLLLGLALVAIDRLLSRTRRVFG